MDTILLQLPADRSGIPAGLVLVPRAIPDPAVTGGLADRGHA